VCEVLPDVFFILCVGVFVFVRVFGCSFFCMYVFLRVRVCVCVFLVSVSLCIYGCGCICGCLCVRMCFVCA